MLRNTATLTKASRNGLPLLLYRHTNVGYWLLVIGIIFRF
jgi:hypothetical protein